MRYIERIYKKGEGGKVSILIYLQPRDSTGQSAFFLDVGNNHQDGIKLIKSKNKQNKKNHKKVNEEKMSVQICVQPRDDSGRRWFEMI